MADMTEGLQAKVARIEQTLDTLSESVDRRFAEVNKRFDEVDKRFDEVDKRFEDVDKRFEDVDKRFDDVSEHFVEQREYTEFAFERLRKEMLDGFTRIEGRMATKDGLARLERRLDSFEGKFDEFLRSQSRPRRRQRSRVPKKR